MPSKYSAYQRKWRAEHPESVRAIWRRSRAKKKEAINCYKRKWRKTLAGRSEAWRNNSTRRARKMNALPVGVDLKLIDKIYARAAELRQWFDVVVDHIIPLAKGGKHEANNLQIIYRRENLWKSARLDFVPSVVFT